METSIAHATPGRCETVDPSIYKCTSCIGFYTESVYYSWVSSIGSYSSINNSDESLSMMGSIDDWNEIGLSSSPPSTYYVDEWLESVRKCGHNLIFVFNWRNVHISSSQSSEFPATPNSIKIGGGGVDEKKLQYLYLCRAMCNVLCDAHIKTNLSILRP